MKNIFLTSLVLLFSISVFGQMNVSPLKSKTHVKQLKEGLLLVNLPNSDKKIKRLEELGQHELAKKEEKEIDNIRKQIIAGFQSEYFFCDYQFIESRHVDEVLKNDLTNIFDADFNRVKLETPPQHVYIVRYGTGNPSGEVYRYNGQGFQVRYVSEGIIESLKDDMFYSAYGSLKQIFKSKSVIEKAVGKLNNRLSNVKL